MVYREWDYYIYISKRYKFSIFFSSEYHHDFDGRRWAATHCSEQFICPRSGIFYLSYWIIFCNWSVLEKLIDGYFCFLFLAIIYGKFMWFQILAFSYFLPNVAKIGNFCFECVKFFLVGKFDFLLWVSRGRKCIVKRRFIMVGSVRFAWIRLCCRK